MCCLRHSDVFVLCYFNEPDKSGHIYGPNSNEVIESIQRADKILGKLIDALEKTPRYVDLDRMEASSPIGWRSNENG